MEERDIFTRQRVKILTRKIHAVYKHNMKNRRGE